MAARRPQFRLSPDGPGELIVPHQVLVAVVGAVGTGSSYVNSPSTWPLSPTAMITTLENRAVSSGLTSDCTYLAPSATSAPDRFGLNHELKRVCRHAPAIIRAARTSGSRFFGVGVPVDF